MISTVLLMDPGGERLGLGWLSRKLSNLRLAIGLQVGMAPGIRNRDPDAGCRILARFRGVILLAGLKRSILGWRGGGERNLQGTRRCRLHRTRRAITQPVIDGFATDGFATDGFATDGFATDGLATIREISRFASI